MEKLRLNTSFETTNSKPFIRNWKNYEHWSTMFHFSHSQYLVYPQDSKKPDSPNWNSNKSLCSSEQRWKCISLKYGHTYALLCQPSYFKETETTSGECEWTSGRKHSMRPYTLPFKILHSHKMCHLTSPNESPEEQLTSNPTSMLLKKTKKMTINSTTQEPVYKTYTPILPPATSAHKPLNNLSLTFG